MSVTHPHNPHTLVRELGLTRMTTNCLIAEGIATLGDLLKQSERQIGKIPGLGPISVNQLKVRLAKLGLELQPKEKA